MQVPAKSSWAKTWRMECPQSPSGQVLSHAEAPDSLSGLVICSTCMDDPLIFQGLAKVVLSIQELCFSRRLLSIPRMMMRQVWPLLDLCLASVSSKTPEAYWNMFQNSQLFLPKDLADSCKDGQRVCSERIDVCRQPCLESR